MNATPHAARPGKFSLPPSVFVCAMVSLTLWSMLYPGIMSFDSNFMYLNALSNQYFNFRPVLLPLTLSFVLKMGGDIAFVTLIQIMAGTFGIFSLCRHMLILLGYSNRGKIESITICFLLLVLSPLTPASVYFLTVWTDTWLAIALVWALSLLLQIHSRPADAKMDTLIWPMIGYSVATWIVISVRSNSVVTYPFLSILAYEILRQKTIGKITRVLIILTPLCMLFALKHFQKQLTFIQETPPVNAVYALDLASMIVLDPYVCTNASIQSCQLVYKEFPDGFVVGDGAIDFTLSQQMTTNTVPFAKLYYNPRLLSEYVNAARERPWLLLRVKILNYLDYISVNSSRYFYQVKVLEDTREFGLAPSNPGAFSLWFSWMTFVKDHPLLRWVSFVHFPWLILNIFGLTMTGVYYKSDQSVSLLFWILTISASYYGSYLIALTAPEFRFLYPSMLVVQIVVFVMICSLTRQWLVSRDSSLNTV